ADRYCVHYFGFLQIVDTNHLTARSTAKDAVRHPSNLERLTTRVSLCISLRRKLAPTPVQIAVLEEVPQTLEFVPVTNSPHVVLVSREPDVFRKRHIIGRRQILDA